MAALLLCSLGAAPASAQQPDLTISSLVVSGGAQNLVVSSTVQNGGGAAVAGSFTNGYFLSVDSQVTTSDNLLGSFTVNGLTAGGSFTDSSRSLTIPTTLPPGAYFLGVIADSGGAVAESNETNNTSVAAGTVSIPFPAEVVIFPLDAPERVSAGRTFIASFQVVNAGENGFTLASASLAFSGTGLSVSAQSLPASIPGESAATYVFNVTAALNADNRVQTASLSITGFDAVSNVVVADSLAAGGTVQVLAASTTRFTDLNSNTRTVYDLGVEGVFVTVADGNRNTSSSSAQSLVVTVTSSSGDRELVTLGETGNDTGVFRNTQGVPTANGTVVAGDGTLQAAPGAALTASYQDVDDPADQSTAQATIRLSPTAATGQFTNGAGSQVFFFAIGVDRVFVSVTDSDRNTDPVQPNQVTVTVTDGATGDRETVTLVETGAATGVFRNTLGLTSVRNAAPVNNNGNIETADGATVSFSYADPVNGDTASNTAVMRFVTTSTTRFTNGSGGTVSAYTLGIDTAFVTVIDADRNTSSGTADQVPLLLTVSTTGDTENITLRETGVDTGIFRNTAGIPFALAARSDNDGTLQVTGGALLRGVYTDPADASDVSSSTVDVNGQQTASQTVFTDTTGAVQTVYLIGVQEVFVTVTDADENVDPATQQSLTVNIVDGSTGDLEVLTLRETGNSTGVFRNTTGLPTVLGTRQDQNGTLETANLSNVSANYQDDDASADTSFSFAGMRLANTNSETRFTDSAGVPVTQFRLGVDPVFVTVEDRNRNDNVNSRQTVNVSLRVLRQGVTGNIDRESLQLLETGNNTGVFRNATGLPSSFAATRATTENGIVEGRDGDSILVQYVDATDPNDASSGFGLLRFRTDSTTRLTDRDGNEVASYIVPRDGLFVTLLDADKQSPTTGTILPSQVDYDSQVQKVFNRACWKCHSPSGRSAGNLPPAGTPAPNQGGLDLSGFEDLLDGGNSGTVVVAGNGAGSLVVRKINGQAAHQGGAVPTVATTDELNIVKTWIDQGAVPPTAPTSVDYTRELEVPLFRGRCDTSGCHDSATRSGGLNMTPPSQLAFVANNRVTPGDGPSSRVVRILKGELPHTGGRAGLSDEQIRLISVWISQRIQDSDPSERMDFTGDVLPLLDRSCNNSRCHDAVNPSGNLDLTTFATLVRGGTGGNPTVPGDGPNSLLIRTIDGRINHTGGFGDPPLSPQETQEVLQRWINQGVTGPPAPPAGSQPVTTNSLVVVVTDSATGDREELIVRELANFLGTFRNPVPFRTAVQPAATRNDTYDTAGGATVTATYIDPLDPDDTSQDTASIALNPTGSVVTFTDGSGATKTQFAIGAINNGDRVFITLEDANRNANPLQFDFANVTLLDSVTGDSETVQLREITQNSTFFRNQFGVASEVGLALGDGKLQTAGGSTISANYQDPTDPGDFNFALASMFVTPGATAPRLIFTDAAGTEQTDVPITKDPLFPTLFVTVLAEEENTNASVRESLTVTVFSPRDRVTFTVRETGISTSTFRNPAGVALLLGDGNPNNTALEAFDGDQLTAQFFSARRNQTFSSIPGRFVARITPGNSTVNITALDGSPITTFAVGQELFVTVTDPDQNGNPNTSETLTVTVTSTETNDTETITLLETNCNTGVFRNTLTLCPTSLGSTRPLTSNIAVPVSGNGFLETASNAIVRATYQDPNDATDRQQSAVTALVPEVASSVAFIRAPRAIGTVSSFFIGDLAGQPIFLRVIDADANSSPISTQLVNVSVRDPNTGDVEAITLSEIASSSAVFENIVGLRTRVTTASPNDAVLGTQDGSRIVVTYQDSTNPLDRATAAATLAVTQTPATTIFFTDSIGSPKVGPFIIGREGVFVTLADEDENKSPSVAETVRATLSSSVTGDVETLLLQETATDSGLFRNVSPGLISQVDAARANDGILQTAQSATLVATYVDVDQTTDRLSTIPGATTSRPALIGFPVFTDRDDNPVNSYVIGLQPIFIRLVDADQNTNPLTRETVTGQVRLSSPRTGDLVSLTLTETQTSSGIFRNATGLETRVGQAILSDSILQVNPGESILAQYFDTKPAEVTTATARMDVQRTRAAVTLQSVPRGTARATFVIGTDSVFVQVEDPDQNSDPFTTETVQVTLRNESTGDTELVNLQERTANDRFFDSIAGVSSVIDTALPGDNVIQASDNSTLKASYIDRLDLTDRAEATAVMRVPKSNGSIELTDNTGTPRGSFGIGQDFIFVTVTDADRNTDASSAQSVRVSLTDLSGDRMELDLAETSFNSGIFRNLDQDSTGVPVIGRVASRVALPLTTNGTLETLDNSTITASYTDERATTVTAIFDTAQAVLSPSTSTASFTNDAGAAVQFYTIGISGIFVTVGDVDENRDPRVQERIRVDVRSEPVGDVESLDLIETTSSSAVFRNLLPLSSTVGPRIVGNAILETNNGGTLVATYTDAQTPADVSSATVPVFLDSANGRVFFTRSATGSIVATEPGYAVVSDQSVSERVFVEVRDADENVDGSSAQSLIVSLSVRLPDGSAGDFETLTLTELSASSDTFRNAIGMPTVLGPFRSNDRAIQTTDGALLFVTYIDKDFVFDRSETAVRTRIRQTASILETVDAAGVGQSRYLVSVEPIFVQVTDPDENRSPALAESVDVTLTSILGDVEPILAVETGLDTGVFRTQSGVRAIVTTVLSPANGTLELLGSGVAETISARYVDRDDAADAPSLSAQVVFQEPSAVEFLDSGGNVVTSYVRGRDGIIVRVRDRDRNRSAGAAETVTASLEDLSTTDVEVLTLTETGLNTGLFSNAGRPVLSTLVFPLAASPGNGSLEASALSHQIRAVYRDDNDPTDTSSSTASLNPADPADSDGDGMPDSFELANQLNPADPRDATLDNDGDGRTNLQEFRDGTDPNNAQDNRPVARPGQPRSVQPGFVELDGTASTSPGGLPLTYRWRQVTGPTVTLNGSSTATPNFIAFTAGLYEFELTVNNGRSDSFPNRLPITVIDAPPVADAGPAITVDAGQAFTFLGEASRDPNGAVLSYSWLPLAGALPPPQNGSTSRPIFTPQSSRFYPIQLTVTDPGGSGAVARGSLIVNAGPSDRLPTADAGLDRTARAGTSITLDGSGSADSDGGNLTYRWSFVSGPEAAVLIPAGSRASFTPLLEGVFVFELVVNDSATGDPARASAPDRVTLVVNGSNTVPTASPGPDLSASTGSRVVLDGRASRDADGDPVTYLWTQLGGSSVTLSDATSSAPSFTPVVPGVATFQLVVRDGRTSSKPAIVRVMVNSTSDRVPIANAGVDTTGTPGSPVQLSGASSFDPDGRVLSYVWSQVEGANLTLAGPFSPTPAFTPSRAGLYAFELVVSDGTNLSVPDRIEIAVGSAANPLPVAVAGPDQTAFVGSSPLVVQLDGRGSSDAGGRLPLTYTWSQVGGTNVTLVPDAEAATPTFVAPGTGNFEFSLVVRNSAGLRSSADTVLITIVDGTNAPPLARINNGTPGGSEIVRTALDQVVTLDASSSQSLNGSQLSFLWTQVGGPPVVLSSRTGAQVTFIPRQSASYAFKVTVSDAQGNSSESTVTVFAGTADPGSGSGTVDLGSVPQAGGGSGCTMAPPGAPAPLELTLLLLVPVLVRRRRAR